MRTRIATRTLSLLIFLVSGCGTDPNAEKTDLQKDTLVKKDTLVGGECDYKNYDGTAKIISIEDFPKGYAGCLEGSKKIKFIFNSVDPNSKTGNNNFFKDTGFIQINNEMKLSKEIVQGLNIKTGREFKCIKKVIVKGTCTPVIFGFPDDSLISSKFCE